MTTLKELSGILNWELEGYYRLRKIKTFTALKSVDERRKEWKEMSDPLSLFIANCVEWGAFYDKGRFLSFRDYCLKIGFRVKSKERVGRKMKELGYKEGQRTKNEEDKPESFEKV